MSEIRKRKLGRTGFMATEIGLGGIPIMQVQDLDEAARLITYGLDRGINYIDTARAYADSEKKFGLALKGRRHEVFLATKTHAYDYDAAWKYLETSLTELQTDYLDVWHMHDISTRERWEKIRSQDGALRAAHEARDQGLIRYIGVTSHNDELLLECMQTGEFDVILCVYNLAIHIAGEKCLPYANEHDIGVTIMKPLSGGIFFRREETYVDPLKAWWFVLQNPHVNVACAGFKDQRDIDQAIEASRTFRPLDEAEIQDLVSRARFLGEDVCRACGYCRDCPAEIPIPEIMRIADEARVFSYEWPRFRREYEALYPKADACVDCGQCEEHCPFNLKIRERLRMVHQYFGQPV